MHALHVEPQGLRCVGDKVTLLARKGQAAVERLVVLVERTLRGRLEVAFVARILDLVVDSVNVLLETHLPVGDVVALGTLEGADHVLLGLPRLYPHDEVLGDGVGLMDDLLYADRGAGLGVVLELGLLDPHMHGVNVGLQLLLVCPL